MTIDSARLLAACLTCALFACSAPEGASELEAPPAEEPVGAAEADHRTAPPPDAWAVEYDPALEQVEDFGDNPGGVDMYRYAPEGLPAGPRPLVVAIHGCKQSGPEYHAYSGWSDMADAWGFVVVYPDQDWWNNMLNCWSWFQPWDIQRDRGEAASIASMVARTRADFDIDPARIYVTGVSSGGFMTAVMAAAYPDVFAGAAVNAGGPYACADDAWDGFACAAGVDRSPAQWAAGLVELNGYDEPADVTWPALHWWQGTADTKVGPVNMTEGMEQWTELQGIDRVADAAWVAGHDTSVLEYHDAAGEPRVVTFEIEGMAHGMPVDPESGCGDTGTDYYLDEGLCTAEWSGLLWGLDVEVEDEDEVDGEVEVDEEVEDEPAFACRDWTDFNNVHLLAGRIELCGWSLCAVGSGDDVGIGIWITTVREIEQGWFEQGGCP